jgi:predicted alpha/beta-hydrolase family hydrolase
LNVHGVKDVRQTEIHTAEPPVPESSATDFEMAFEKLKTRKSPGVDQISAELIKEGYMVVRFEIHNLINSI